MMKVWFCGIALQRFLAIHQMNIHSVSDVLLLDATDGVSRPQLKTQTQVRASQMQSYVTRAPAVVF